MQRDAWKVVIGVVIFLGFFTFPIWYNLALGQQDWNEPTIAAGAGSECIMERSKIRVEHMELLDDWRDEAVREAHRFRPNVQGTHRNKSLTKTCMGCHTDREEFCGRCHTFVGVEGELFSEVYCWDCHVDSTNVSGRGE